MIRPSSIALVAFFLASDSWGDVTSCVVGVTVIDVINGERLPARNVVVSGERIESVTGEAPPDDACDVLVDASRRFAIPGLWDMHVHGTRREQHWPIYIANGVTGVRDLFGPSDPGELRRRLAAAPVKPRVVVSGPIIDGPPGIWPGSVVVSDADEARSAVAGQAAAGADLIKVYQLLSRDAYFAILEEAGSRGIPVAGHVPSTVTAREAVEAGQGAIEHVMDLPVSCAADEDQLRASLPDSFIADRERDVEAFRSFDQSKCRELAQLFLDHGTWLVPTWTVKYLESQENIAAAVDLDRAKFFDAETRSWLIPEEPVPADERATLRGAYRVDVALLRLMQREGVPILAGSDVMNPWVFPGFALHDELELLVDAGLTPLAALQAATINAAKYLGREHELGSVEPGKLADVVLLESDPLLDIRNSTGIYGVISGGVYHDRAALDEMLDNAIRAANQGAEREPP